MNERIFFMNIKIETISPSPLAFIRRYGPYSAENVETMEKLKSWASANNLMNENAVILGIVHDSIAKTNPENCRYDACIILEKDAPLENRNEIKMGMLAGGAYAIFTIEHTPKAMGIAWTEIFPALIKEGYTFDQERPILERYAAKLVANHNCEICVPIQ